MISLHTIMAEVRAKYKDWQRQNPYDHPAKLHRIQAEEVVSIAKKRGAKEVSIHKTVMAGGVPEYAQAVGALCEAGIRVLEADPSALIEVVNNSVIEEAPKLAVAKPKKAEVKHDLF